MTKVKPLVLNDGVVTICREKDRDTGFGARRNPRTAEDLENIAELCFEEMSCREQDFEFAAVRGFSLSKKIRTYRRDDVESDCRAVIGDDLYSIGHIDKSKVDMFIYMSSVGKLEVSE